MADAHDAPPPSKKRAAGREISKDNPGLDDDEDTSEQEPGTFKRASDEVLSTRRIVKVRRHQNTPASSPNPFAGVRLVSAATASESQEVHKKKVPEAGGGEDDAPRDREKGAEEAGDNGGAKVEDEEGASEVNEKNDNKKIEGEAEAKPSAESDSHSDKSNDASKGKLPEPENEEAKEHENENSDPSGEAAQLSSFHQLSSSRNAFTGLAGAPNPAFSFGSIPKDASASAPSGFGLSNNGSSSLFGTKTGGGGSLPSLQEVPLETGEENEKPVLTADSVLFEYIDGGWKERGKGEVKVNVSATGTGKARLVMRTKGNYRLILNASLFPDMKLASMEKRGITFACVNSIGEGDKGLSTFALKFKDGAIVEEFRSAVMAHKDRPVVIKTPENSPKATNE